MGIVKKIKAKILYEIMYYILEHSEYFELTQKQDYAARELAKKFFSIYLN